MSVKLILVEDHDIVRQGIHSLLQDENDIEIVGEAQNGKEALDLCARVSPDLVLMDMNMPVMNGSEATRQLKKRYPKLKVLILSMHDDESYLIEMLEAGADGYVLKSSRKDELLFAIRKVVSGGSYIGSEFIISILEKYKSRTNHISELASGILLSEGERQILDLIAEGLTNAEMAEKLFISVRTVESRRKKLLEKTGTVNTATLIKFALKNGLLK